MLTKGTTGVMKGPAVVLRAKPDVRKGAPVRGRNMRRPFVGRPNVRARS